MKNKMHVIRQLDFTRLIRNLLYGELIKRGASKTNVIPTQGFMAGVVIIATILFSTFVPSLLVAQKTSVTTNPKGSVGYAMMGPSNEIAVIDMNDKKILGSIPVEGNPHGGALTPDGNYIYASSMGSDWVSVVDTRSQKVVEKIEVGSVSHHATVRPDGRYVYVAAGQLVVIDTATNEIVGGIETPESPFYPIFAPDGRRLYVLNMGSTISVIDTKTQKLINTIDMGAKSMMGHLAAAHDGKTIYATNDTADRLSILDVETGKLRAKVPVGKQPHGVAVSEDDKYVFVSNRGEPNLSVINVETAEVVETLELGGYPEHLSMTADGNYLLAGLKDRFQKKDSRQSSSRNMTAAITFIDPNTLKIVEEISAWPQVHDILVPQNK
jgi:YVTN family beta-propeller protein